MQTFLFYFIKCICTVETQLGRADSCSSVCPCLTLDLCRHYVSLCMSHRMSVRLSATACHYLSVSVAPPHPSIHPCIPHPVQCPSIYPTRASSLQRRRNMKGMCCLNNLLHIYNYCLLVYCLICMALFSIKVLLFTTNPLTSF